MLGASTVNFCILLPLAIMAVHGFDKTREKMATLYEHGPKERVDGVYIVKIEKSCNVKCFNDIIEEFIESTKREGFPVSINHRMESMRMFTGTMSRQAVEMIRWVDQVEFVEEDQIVTIQGEDSMGVGIAGV